MANDKTYDRHVNIWINGKEVKNDISSIKKEMFNLSNETNRATRGTKEYYEKAEELKKVKAILKEHQEAVTNTGTAWTKVKGMFSGAQGILLSGIAGVTAGYQALKGVITSTGALSDKFEATLGGWKGGIDALARSVATLSDGGLNNLGKKIREGINEGRRYAESLDAIDEKTRALQIAEAETANEILRQTEISKSARYSKEQQIAAGTEIIRLEEKLAKIRSDIGYQAAMNEAKNIASITHLTEDEVLAFARQDEYMMKNIETGAKYNEFLRLNSAYISSIDKNTGKSTFSQASVDRLMKLREEFANVSDEIVRFGFAAANMPGDEKMAMFVDKYVAYQQSLGSALENTMKTRVRLASNEKSLLDDGKSGGGGAGNDGEAFAARRRAEKEKQGVEEMKRLEEQYKAEEELRIKYEEKEKADEDKRREEREKAGVQEMERLKAQGEAILRMEEEHAAMKINLAASVSNFLGAIAGKNKALQKAALIAEKAVAIADIIIQTRRANAAMRAWGALGGPIGMGFATAAIIKNNISAGLDIAAVVASTVGQFWAGGYTGSGAKYEPKGIVHADEWVANREMVASPVTGPVIRALENSRQTGSYAAGGDVNSGGSAMSSGQGGAAALFGTDPEMKAIMNSTARLLQILLEQGVKNVYTWKDADSLRKGMSKLDDIEGSVSL
jgi:hypothetical protein